MRVKDGALALAITHIFVNAIQWQSENCIWLVYVLFTYAAWELILRIEQFARWLKKKLLKMKNARGAATPGRAHMKINFK